MADIVERLRTWHLRQTAITPDMMMEEAAKHIESLRADKKRLQEGNTKLWGRYKAIAQKGIHQR